MFRIGPGGSETVLYSFASQPNDGNEPLGWLVQGSGGNLYGTTVKGGSGNGTLYELTVPLTIATNQITQIRLIGTNVVLSILSAPGDTYQLLSTTNLAAAAWSNVTGAAVTNSSGGLITVTNFGGAMGAQTFYRFAIGP